MSFLIQNITGSPGSNVELNDLGITIQAGVTYDARFLQPQDIAASADIGGDLYNAINTDKLIVLDPLDGVTPLTKAQSIELGQVHNDPHFRIRGGTLNQLDDVDTTGAQSGDVLQLIGGTYVTATPEDIVGGGAAAVTDLFVNGVNTTVTRTGSPLTAIQIDVDDVFLKNTGDTLDSGTLTIASGAAVDFPTGSSLTIQDGATATIITPTGGFDGATDIVNKAYVDSVAAGLDPKESVRVASLADVGGAFVAGSPVGPGDTIAGADGVIDGVTLVSGDRVLVKNQTDNTENGIYVVQTVNGGSPVTVDLVRATDQDGTPANEVSAGNFTFVEQGTQANTGWVVAGDGVLTLGTDPIIWVQFSESSDFQAGAGLGLSGNTFFLDVDNLTPATITTADEIAFNDVTDSNTTRNTTVANFLADLDIVSGITTNGFVARTGEDTYVSRSIVASTLDDRVGIEVLNGNGVSGNPTVGLDIENLPYITSGSPAGVISSADRVAVYDVDLDRNVYYQVSDIAGALASTNSFETFRPAGNATGVDAVADSSTDIMLINAGNGIAIAVANDPESITYSLDLSTVPAMGSPSTLDATDRIVINDGGTTTSVTLQELIDGLSLGTDVCALSDGNTATLDTTDTIAVCDSGTTVKFTLGDIFQTLDVVSGVTGTGLVVKTGGSPDTYATRSVVESTTAGQEGAQVNNGDGASGNIEIGVDINNLSNSADDMAAADEFIVYDGANNVSMSGQQVADGVATILNLPDLVVSTINGQPIVTYTDTTRGTGSPPSGKRLSTDMLEYTWSQADVGNDDWIEIGNAVDALTGYIMPLNATIVGVVAQCTDADNKNKSIIWYKDGTSQGTLFSFTGDGEQVYNSFVSMNLDIDINQGEKIRLRGDSSSGTIKDIVITIYVRLRA